MPKQLVRVSGEVGPLLVPRLYTDGGPWGHHNFPCPVCWDSRAVVNLDGWIAEPCWECQRGGWQIQRKDPRPWWRRWLNLK